MSTEAEDVVDSRAELVVAELLKKVRTLSLSGSPFLTIYIYIYDAH
jgi:hypothetical protein